MCSGGSGAKDDGSRPLKKGASLLQGELERICWELGRLHRRWAQLWVQHKLLEREAQKLHTKSQEFLGYMSLGDKSRQLQVQIQREHWELLARSAEQETVLRHRETDSHPPVCPPGGGLPHHPVPMALLVGLHLQRYHHLYVFKQVMPPLPPPKTQRCQH